MRVALALSCAALAAGCTAGAPAQPEASTAPAAASPPGISTLDEGTLTACVAPTPAIAAEADGTWEGFDVAVLEGVAEHLALTLEVTATTFDELVSGVALNGGRCDVGAAAVVDADALDAVVRTSAPYRTVERLVVAPEPASPVEPSALTGRVGVEDGGPANDVVESLGRAEVVPYPSRADLGRALGEGAVPAALVTATGRLQLQEELGVALGVTATVPTEERTVLLLPLSAADEVVEAIDAALEGLRADGRLEALRDQWLRP